MLNGTYSLEQPWLTSNTMLAYPFIDSGAGSTLPPSDIRTLFVDAYIRYSEPVVSGGPIRSEELTLTYFNYDGNPINSAVFGIKLVWKTSAETFFDTTVGSHDFTVFTYGQWVVLGWVQGKKLIKVTVSLAALQGGSITYPVIPDIYPSFLTSLVENWSYRVTSLASKVHGGADPVAPNILSGDVVLVSGYNTVTNPTSAVSNSTPSVADISQRLSKFFGTDNKRLSNTVEIAVQPGVGKGLYPPVGCDCESGNIPLMRVNNVTPSPSGNIEISGDGCILAKPLQDHAGALVANTIQLASSCDVCCSCSDYVATYNKLRDVWLRLSQANTDLTNLLAKYECMVMMMQARYSCIEPRKADLKLYPKHGYLLTFQVLVQQNQSKVVDGVSINLGISGGSWKFVEGSGYFFSPLMGRVATDPGLSKDIPFALGPGTMVIYEAEVLFSSGTGGAAVDGTVTIDGVDLPVSASVGLMPFLNRDN